MFVLTFNFSARPGTLAQFRTAYGNIDVELYDQDKPVTVRNFLRYVQSGAYTNMFFHRCLTGFVIQSGGFKVTDRTDTNDATVFYGVSNFGPITNEFNVGPRRSNVYGTLAMAKLDGDPDSASSQWFFNLADNSTNLDNQNGGFTVFGQVVGGTNVLNQINALSKSETNAGGIVDLRWWYGSQAAVFSDLPVSSGLDRPRFVDLSYVDVSLLGVQAQAVGSGKRQISWKSVGNKVNTVEFATNLPPVWQTLATTNGTGSVVSVTDSSTSNSRRFYRVRVDY